MELIPAGPSTFYITEIYYPGLRWKYVVVQHCAGWPAGIERGNTMTYLVALDLVQTLAKDGDHCIVIQLGGQRCEFDLAAPVAQRQREAA